LKHWLKRIVLLLAGIALFYVGFVLIVWRDLPVDVLEQKYWSERVPEDVEIDGVTLRYKVEGEGPPVLLLHSHFFSMLMWDSWVELLAGRYTLIRFDMTSHGLTGPDPSGDYGMPRSLMLIEGLLDHLGLDRVTAVGSSLGGNMAFNFAAKHPTRVDRLVLINSGGIKREDSRSGSDIPTWADAVARLLPRRAYRTFLSWMVDDDTLVNQAMLEEFHDGFRREGNRPAELDRLRGFVVEDPKPLLAGITAPTMIMWGEKNPQLPYELAEEFRSELTSAPEVRVEILPDAGHVLPLERPALSAALFNEFMAGEPDGILGLPAFVRGPHEMSRSDEVVLTHANGRQIPARAFYPVTEGLYPLIVFSHGFASNKDQYGRLIEHWVSHGYAVLAGDHEDSGGTISAILASVLMGEVELVQSRANDMALLLENLRAFPELAGRTDGTRIAAAGHSFGAFTAQMLMGAVAIDDEGKRWGYQGPPVQAALAISPPGEMFDVIRSEGWSTQHGPVLMTTGTADIDGRFVSDWRQHLLSFEQAQPGDQYALVIDGADHYLGNLICRLDQEPRSQFAALAIINTVTTLFLDTWLKNDADAGHLLDSSSHWIPREGKAELRKR